MCESDITPARPGRGGQRSSLARVTADAVGRHISEVLNNENVAARAGLLQRIEPRVKLLAIVVFSVTASVLRSPWLLGAVCAIALGLAAASAVSPASFARKVWGSAGLFAALIAAPATTRLVTPGPVLLPLGTLSLTMPGVIGAATLVLRVVASTGFALLIVWTMRWTDLLAALSRLRVPDIVVATLAMTQQQIVSLMRTVEHIHLARESRTLAVGATSENRAWVTDRMAFVVHKSVKTADDVYDAMLSRGYSGSIRLLPRASGGRRDWLYLLAATCLATALIGLDGVIRS